MRRYRSLQLGDPVLFGLVVGLARFGIAMIYSAGVLDVPDKTVVGAWRQQLMWFMLALLVVPAILRVPIGWLEWGAQPAYALALVLLVLALFFGGGEGTAASTKSWLYVGPVHVQPAEVAKIATARSGTSSTPAL